VSAGPTGLQCQVNRFRRDRHSHFTAADQRTTGGWFAQSIGRAGAYRREGWLTDQQHTLLAGNTAPRGMQVQERATGECEHESNRSLPAPWSGRVAAGRPAADSRPAAGRNAAYPHPLTCRRCHGKTVARVAPATTRTSSPSCHGKPLANRCRPRYE